MKNIDCCNSPVWNKKTTDLGRVDSFEFVLLQCSNCGAFWMDVFCAPVNTSAYERISDEDAKKMLEIPAGTGLKEFLKNWFKNR